MGKYCKYFWSPSILLFWPLLKNNMEVLFNWDITATQQKQEVYVQQLTTLVKKKKPTLSYKKKTDSGWKHTAQL